MLQQHFPSEGSESMKGHRGYLPIFPLLGEGVSTSAPQKYLEGIGGPYIVQIASHRMFQEWIPMFRKGLLYSDDRPGGLPYPAGLLSLYLNDFNKLLECYLESKSYVCRYAKKRSAATLLK